MNGLEWILVVVGFAGWTVTLVALMKYLLPMANALSVLHKLDAYIDDRITKILERLEARRTGRTAPPAAQKPASEPPRHNAARDALKDVFGGPPLVEGLDEQPDAGGIEVVSA